MVRRHDRLGAAGPNTVLREAEQSGQCLYSATELEPSIQPCAGQPSAHIASRGPADPEQGVTVGMKIPWGRGPCKCDLESKSPLDVTGLSHKRPYGFRDPGDHKCQYCLLYSEDVVSIYFTG